MSFHSMYSGSKVVLRPLLEQDLKILASWDEDAEVAYLMGSTSKDHENTTEWYLKMMRSSTSMMFMVETRDGIPIGDIELTEIAWRRGEAELVVRIGEKSYWGQGYGTDAVLTLLHMAFTRLKLNRVYLRVLKHNERAIRCYTKCGFLKEGIVRRRFEGEDNPREILLMTMTRARYAAGIRALAENAS